VRAREIDDTVLAPGEGETDGAGVFEGEEGDEDGMSRGETEDSVSLGGTRERFGIGAAGGRGKGGIRWRNSGRKSVFLGEYFLGTKARRKFSVGVFV
jgi:hypothetical protein